MLEEERKEHLEHQEVLLDIRAVLVTKSGKSFFKYLFKHLEIGELPELGMEGNILYDKLGFLRAGNAIFSIVSEASPKIAAEILAENEREKHANRAAERARTVNESSTSVGLYD